MGVTVQHMVTATGPRALAVDVLLAVGSAALLVTDAALIGPGGTVPAPLDYALILAGCLALVARRRAPRTVLVGPLLCVLTYTARVGPGLVAAAPKLIAIYTAVAAGHRLLTTVLVTPVVLGLVVQTAIGAAGPAREAIQTSLLPVGWIVASAVLGQMSRQREALLQQVEQRALEAERTREEVARRRAGEERLRISRELHDSLTHLVSIIKVQAGVAVHLARKRGEEVPTALLAIEEASAEAARELRATLEVLRGEEHPAGTAGLDRLGELVERARAAGLPVTASVTGTPRGLPAEVDRAAYRIVQEALTNVARHAGRAAATVRVHHTPAAVTVQVDDDGPGPAVTLGPPGVGLVGMRERVAALGGELAAGPRGPGGFTVRAELPVQPAGETTPATPATAGTSA